VPNNDFPFLAHFQGLTVALEQYYWDAYHSKESPQKVMNCNITNCDEVLEGLLHKYIVIVDIL
jgi:hypothetical protein